MRKLALLLLLVSFVALGIYACDEQPTEATPTDATQTAPTLDVIREGQKCQLEVMQAEIYGRQLSAEGGSWWGLTLKERRDIDGTETKEAYYCPPRPLGESCRTADKLVWEWGGQISWDSSVDLQLVAPNGDVLHLFGDAYIDGCITYDNSVEEDLDSDFLSPYCQGPDPEYYRDFEACNWIFSSVPTPFTFAVNGTHSDSADGWVDWGVSEWYNPVECGW